MTEELQYELRAAVKEITSSNWSKDLILRNIETGVEDMIRPSMMGEGSNFEQIFMEEAGEDAFHELYYKGATRLLTRQNAANIWGAYSNACNCE